MNKLNNAKRAQVVAALVEGNSIRATVRMTGVAKNTIAKLLVELGSSCSEYLDRTLRNLSCKRIQCDEIWQFCYAKEKSVPEELRGKFGYGDVWTWVAIDADTKLIPSFTLGTRGAQTAKRFMDDLASRLANRVQLTTDGHRVYLQAVEDAFGSNIDYAMLVKLYGTSSEPETRYSPAQCIGAMASTVTGRPDARHISTSYVERQNLTMRMSATFYAADKWILEESRESSTRAGPLLHVLQFLPCSSDPPSYASNGSWNFKSRMGTFGNSGIARKEGRAGRVIQTGPLP